MLVSILIPCHNNERYISRCINSVVRQTYSKLQVIVVDDGSTDNSWNVIKKIAKTDSRIECYKQRYQGVANARNNALSHALGEAVMFIDADDWIEPNTVEVLQRNLAEHNLDFCACSMVRDSCNGESSLYATHQTFEILDQQEAKYNFLTAKTLQGSVCNKLIRKETIGDLQFENGWNYAEDAMFTWRLLDKIKSCGQMSLILYHYSITPNSLTEDLYNDTHLTYIVMWENICNDVAINNPHWSGIARGRMGNAIASVLYDIARTKITRPKLVKNLCNKLKTCFISMFNRKVLSTKYILFSAMAFTCWPMAVKVAIMWHKIRN